MFQTILSKLNLLSAFVIDDSIPKNDYVPLNLSVDNSDLEHVNVSSSEDLGRFVNNEIVRQGGKIAYGGYLETRGIYRRSSYFNQLENPADERNIHLGMDIWIDAGTNVLAALDGEVHSFKNNQNYGDYGPTIILKHQFDALTFYTLYGHLSIESLAGLAVGKRFEQGDVIAQLGTAEVNGDYPPHLHFQIILDMEDYFGDFPGVSSLNTLEFYKKNCPDPNLLLGLG